MSSRGLATMYSSSLDQLDVRVSKRFWPGFHAQICTSPTSISPHYTLRFGAIRPILECLPWQRSALAAARKLCGANRIDVVHHVTWGSIHVGSKLWKLRKPFVFGPVGGGQIAQWRFRRHLRGGWHLEMLRSLTVHYLTGIFFNARSTVSHVEFGIGRQLGNSSMGQPAGRPAG